MLVFSTRLPLKDEITHEACMRLFIEWITGSPHYSINTVAYDVSSHDDFDCLAGNITISIRHFSQDQIEISAGRFENREKNAVWCNDCIFLNENGQKSLLIQLNCNSTIFNTQLPNIHKPHIVRKVVESGFCKDDMGIPVADTPIDVDATYYDICVDIMRGNYTYSMPIVYISCDYWGGTVISPKFMAKQLSGVAHVFVEKSYETALRLRNDTDGNNAYTGYVGIYFPGTTLCQKHGLEYYDNDYRAMASAIINDVRRALINRLDSSVYNWNQILTLQSRQKMSEWQDISAQDKAQLNTYMDTFDAENESLRQQIEELNRETYSLRSQLDALRVSMKTTEGSGHFYRAGEEPELYPSEKSDLLYSILTQVQDRYDQSSRAYTIIQSLLAANPKVGECSRITTGVRSVFNGQGRLTKADIASLKELGFTVKEDGPHYKLTFHDTRYMFTASKTPSDHREGKNLISDICKVIDIERKI